MKQFGVAREEKGPLFELYYDLLSLLVGVEIQVPRRKKGPLGAVSRL
jgi:hypothetical protein